MTQGDNKKPLNFLVLHKKGERFLFLWDDESQNDLGRELAKLASDPELCFSWTNAAELAILADRL